MWREETTTRTSNARQTARPKALKTRLILRSRSTMQIRKATGHVSLPCSTWRDQHRQPVHELHRSLPRDENAIGVFSRDSARFHPSGLRADRVSLGKPILAWRRARGRGGGVKTTDPRHCFFYHLPREQGRTPITPPDSQSSG